MKYALMFSICLAGSLNSHAQKNTLSFLKMPEIKVVKKSYWGNAVTQQPNLTLQSNDEATVLTLPLDNMPCHVPANSTTALIKNKITPLQPNGIPNAMPLVPSVSGK